MFSTLIKRKLTDNQVANIFINALYDSIDNGFSEVAQLINEDLGIVAGNSCPSRILMKH